MEKLLAPVLIMLSFTATALPESLVPKDRPKGNFPPPAAKQMWARSVLGQKAPELVVEKWLTPEPNCAGKFVLVEFWATWWKPSRNAIPSRNRIQKQFRHKLVVIGISDEPEEKVRAVAMPAMEYASAIDTQGRMKRDLKVQGVSHVILIDPKGVVRWEGNPLLKGHELTEDVLEEILAK
jgi:cytochrome c biogenesis protein CcmG/thiol:disulfide interchange protein DsbE